MKGSIYSKNIRRTIFGSLGRYIAILAIIALGVGFFAGIKNTKASMMITCDDYVEEYNMYDFRLVSTYGFTEDDEKAIRNTDKVAAAEGSVTADFFSLDKKGNSIVLRAHSITEKINNVDLLEGRMPEADDECLADSHFYSAKDIGKKIKVTDENDKAEKDALAYEEYRIVGIMNSPYYMVKTERGTTSLGDGRIDAYIYAPAGAFTSEYFTELFVKCTQRGFIFSEEYDDNMSAAEPVITKAANERAQVRYDDIVSEAEKEITKGKAELDDGKAVLENKKISAYDQLDNAKATLDQKSRELSSGKQELQSQKSSLTSQRQMCIRDRL